jgi:hypothetical protein
VAKTDGDVESGLVETPLDVGCEVSVWHVVLLLDDAVAVPRRMACGWRRATMVGKRMVRLTHRSLHV